MKRRWGIIVMIALVLVTAPNVPGNPAATLNSLAPQHVGADGPLHDIVIRRNPATGASQLVNRLTGQQFIPIGNNYIRLNTPQPQATIAAPRLSNTFDPGLYDPNLTETTFRTMQQYGYNTVRLFVWPDKIGKTWGRGLDDTYLANLTDALNRAKNHNFHPILSVTGLPRSGGYAPRTINPPGYLSDTQDTDHFTSNWYYLTQQALDARKRYLTDLITGLKNHNAPLASVLAYDLTGEITFLQNRYPLELRTGQETTKSGTFDLSDESARERMMDINLVDFIDGQVDAVRAVDPYGLTSVQLVPDAINTDPTVYTFRSTWPMLSPDVTDAQGRHGSKVDFVTLSLYPTFDKSMDELMSSFGLPTGDMRKPRITMEMGYLDYYLDARPNLTLADLPPRLVQWERDSCRYGVNGWLYYTWDSPHSVTPYYNAIENNALFARALAPRTIPDVCGLAEPARPTIALPTAACVGGHAVITFSVSQAENVTRYDVYRMTSGGTPDGVKIGTIAPSDFQAGSYLFADNDRQLQEEAYYTYYVMAYDENNRALAATPALSYHAAQDVDDLRNALSGQQYSGFKKAPTCTVHPIAPARSGTPLPGKPQAIPAVQSTVGAGGSPQALPPHR